MESSPYLYIRRFLIIVFLKKTRSDVMKIIDKWKKRVKRAKKGHKVYKTLKRNSNKIVSVVEMIHKSVIK